MLPLLDKNFYGAQGVFFKHERLVDWQSSRRGLGQVKEPSITLLEKPCILETS